MRSFVADMLITDVSFQALHLDGLITNFLIAQINHWLKFFNAGRCFIDEASAQIAMAYAVQQHFLMLEKALHFLGVSDQFFQTKQSALFGSMRNLSPKAA